MFKSLSLAVLVVSLAALSGCASTQATTSDEQLEPNAILAHRNLNGEWEVTGITPLDSDDPPNEYSYRLILIEVGNNRLIGALYDPPDTLGSGTVVGIKNGTTLTLYTGLKLEGQAQSRNVIAGTSTTRRGSIGTWSMTRIR